MITLPRTPVRVALVTGAVSTLACAGVGINKGDFSIISIGEEWALGEQLSADIATEMPLLESPEIVAYITEMGETVLAQAQNDTPIAQKPWSFHVVDSPDVNAFNIPGGHVYFNAGLISAADSYAEVMAVMGHEVSHGLARHGVENLSKQYGVIALASLVLGENPSVYESILANVLAGGAVSKFSRDAEREADRLGLGYVHGAGVDPEGMVSFFETLKSLRGTQPGAIEQFFSTHPLSEERIESARTQIESLPPKSVRRDDPGFERFRQRVAAAATPPRAGS